MPKTPIVTRRCFMDYTHRYSKVLRPIEWNLVETELGIMVEPRQVAGLLDGRIVQQDAADSAFDSETWMDAGTFFSLYGTDGQQMPVDYNAPQTPTLRNPIQSRRGYFVYQNRYQKQVRLVEWNVVDTELGPMVEPRSYGFVDGKVVQIEANEMAFDSEVLLEEGAFASQFGTDGQQLLWDYNA